MSDGTTACVVLGHQSRMDHSVPEGIDLGTQARESLLISRVDGLGVLAGVARAGAITRSIAGSFAGAATGTVGATAVAASAAESLAAVATVAAIATLSTVAAVSTVATVATEALTVTAEALTVATGSKVAGAATGGAGRLMVGVVELEGVLDLALTLALVLDGGGRDEVVIFFLLDGLGRGPGLVNLAALVGLADLERFQAKLLLGALGEEVVESDLLLLRLGRLGGLSIFDLVLALALGNDLGLLVLRNLCAGVLVLLLGVALGSAPRLGSLLLRATGTVSARAQWLVSGNRMTYGARLRGWRSLYGRGFPEPRPGW
jgi:hypothetical protein